MKRYVSTWAPVCALIAISLALISCGKKDPSDAFPAASSALTGVTTDFEPVVMVILPGGSGICTGTIIAPKAVLTAAHCLKSGGRYTISGAYGSKSTYTKESYGPGVVDDPNDIGVLIFDSEVISADKVYSLGDSVSTGDELDLVGYGCTSLTKKTEAGTKRAGTNFAQMGSGYIEFTTPSSALGILKAAKNRAGSCFGDSGGPAIKTVDSKRVIVGVTHAGGYEGSDIISQYCDMTRSDNRNWLATINTNYSLGIQGL